MREGVDDLNRNHSAGLKERRTAMRRPGTVRVFSIVIVLAMGLVGSPLAASEEKTAELLTKLVQTGRKIVSDNQDLINDASKGDKGFTPDLFIDKVITNYSIATGIDLKKPSADAGKLLRALLEAEKETVAEAQPVINRPGMGFKGFIPAVFVRKVAEKFTAKTAVTIKFTAMEYRNARNAPDDFEKKIFERFASPTYPKGKPYQEVVQLDGKKTFRIIFPEYAAKSCLSCHGEPRGEQDITGGKKEGQKEGDLAGALSLTFPLK
jgi:general secretion pathway protein A